MQTGKKVKNRTNHYIFEYENSNLKYDDIYILIKKIKYNKSNECNWQIIDIIDYETKKAGICILFQETRSKKDWIYDLFFLPRHKLAYKNFEFLLKYHSGFYTQYQSARDEINKIIANKISEISKKQQINEIKIFVVGWSLGGSIAPICAEDINYQFGIKPTLITYEGANPCFGFHTRNHILRTIDEDSICFVNGKDFIPRLPPFLFGFIKLTPYIYYLKDKKKYPFLFPVIRNIIWFITDTEKNHTHVDEAIQKYMPRG